VIKSVFYICIIMPAYATQALGQTTANFATFQRKVMAEGLLVLKCSGKVVEGGIISRAGELKKSGRLKNLVIVPGAGEQITEATREKGLTPSFVKGRRNTSEPVLRIAIQSLEGITSGIVEKLEKAGVEASPFLTGVFQARKAVVGGWVGDINNVDILEPVQALLAGKAAILAPLGKDAHGWELNLNADDAAISAATAFHATQLIFATDVNGIEFGGSVLADVTVSALAGLIDSHIVSDGMIPKAFACIKAAEAGIPVRIINGKDPDALTHALEGKGGTVVLPHEVR
jgi:acetylglutamate kinase